MSGNRRACVAITSCLAAALGLAAPPVVHAAVPSASGRLAVLPSCRLHVDFGSQIFPPHVRRPNRWLPLRPGVRAVLHGTVREDDGKLHPHTIVSTVSRVSKRLDGVLARVVFERDYEDGALQESELAFQAQDGRGNVWNLGEYPEEYEHGRLAGAPSTWIAGLVRARPGLAMPARPRLREPAYPQGIAPSVRFHDCARTVGRGHRVCIPLRCVTHTLQVREWAPADAAGGHQLKYYAARVGVIRVGSADGRNPETLHLVRRDRLRRAELGRVDRAVLRQDRRGYRVRPHLYGQTPRARCCAR